MRAGLRFGIAAFAAALALAPLPASAQDTSVPATNTPATETIGPRELENFSLNGTVTRPAPAAPARTTPAPAPRATTPAPQAGAAPTPERTARPTVTERTSAPSVTATPPPAVGSPQSPAPAPAGDFAARPGFESTPLPPMEADDQRANFMPWLLALLLLGAGGGLYVWRQRSQPSYAAAGAVTDSFAAPQPAPAPQPASAPQPLQRASAPRPAPTPASSGIVSTRLRPWLEIEFSPGRCVVENDKATIQFDVAVFNSGAAPARDVLIEASMFNAGPAQDEEIGAFFAHPVAKGDRIPAIPPLKRVALKSAVSLTRDQMRQFEVAGRRLFVPMVGLNALYRWSGGDGQTSASYLVGRDTNADKMAPLRLDLGPRIFRGLGARQHNLAVRT